VASTAAHCALHTAHCFPTQPDPERIEFQAVLSGSFCLFRRKQLHRSHRQKQKAGLPASRRLPLPPDLRARRENSLQRNIKIERQVGLHVVVGKT